MSCRQVRNKLTAYLDAELTASGRGLVEKHFFTCRRCQVLLKTFNLTRTYLAKLKTTPYRDFILDRERIFSVAPLQPVPVLAKSAVLALIMIAAGGVLYFSSATKPLLEIAKKPSTWMLQLGRDISVLPLNKEVIFDTLNPTLVNIGPDSWISLEGKAIAYKDSDYLTIDLERGQLYFISDSSLDLKKIVNVAGLQVTVLGTEFLINSDSYQTDIQLLLGKLTIKYKQASGFSRSKLSSGQAFKAVSTLGQKGINTYRLSARQLSNLTEAVKRIKKSSRWFKSHPKHTHFESGDIRIEYWKED
jgi:hypothetical protein